MRRSSCTAHARRARFGALLLPALLLAPAPPVAARDLRDGPPWFRSRNSGDEHLARAVRFYAEKHPDEVFPFLLGCLRERPRDAGRCARWLVFAIRTPDDRARAVDALAALLDAPREETELGRSTEIQAIVAAGEIGRDARALAPRIAARMAERRSAGEPGQDLLAIARALARIEPGHPDLVPTVGDVLSGAAGSWLRRDALAVLAELGPEGGAAVPLLRETLRDTDPGLVATAIGVLGMLGPAAAAARPDLSERKAALCPDGVPYAAWHAQGCDALLEVIARIEAPEFPSLLHMLESPSPNVRGRAIHAFQRLGPEALPARGTIERTLTSDPDAGVRAASAAALGAIADPASIPALVQALRGRDLRAAALPALGAIGPAASAAREPIEILLLAGSGDAAAAADALARIGDPASVPALLAAAANRMTRAAALRAIEQLGPRAAAARDPLLAMLASDPDPMARRQAASALGGLCDPTTLAALTAALDDLPVRATAIPAIGRLGRRALASRAAVAAAGANADQRLALARIDGEEPAPCDAERAGAP